jgi:hypothetical protein
MLPLAAVTMGLLVFNWYPSQVGARLGTHQLLCMPLQDYQYSVMCM